MTDRKTGRPPKYSEEQVIRGIEIVERTGEPPTGDTVKRAMCTELGVADGINAQSLDKEVQRLLEERERQRRDRLIAALPTTTLGAAKEIGLLVEAAVLGHMGEQHDELRSLASKKLAVLNTDLGNQRGQIRELLSRIETKDEEIAELEGEKHDLKGRLDLALAEIQSLKERVVGFDREEDFRTSMLAVMRETLGTANQCDREKSK